MNPYESSRHKWQHLGTAQYVRVEIRPPRRLAKGDNRHTAILEWLPDDSSEAYQAFHALIDAVLRLESKADRERLYRNIRLVANRDLDKDQSPPTLRTGEEKP